MEPLRAEVAGFGPGIFHAWILNSSRGEEEEEDEKRKRERTTRWIARVTSIWFIEAGTELMREPFKRRATLLKISTGLRGAGN